MASKNKKIRWGIIGTGGIAGVFAETLKKIDGAELAGVGSRSKKTAEAFAKRFDIPNAYGSYQELVAADDIDVVYVATPHPMHMDNTILCLEHKKAVLCEKPLCMNAEQAEKMITAAKENKVFLMEAMWTRFLPVLQKVREVIDAGMIGDLQFARADFSFKASDDPKKRALNPALGGGALLDVGIYCISFLSFIFRRQPDQIKAAARFAKTGVDAQTTAIFTYNESRTAVFNTAIDLHTDRRAAIYGTKGYIVLSDNFYKADWAKIVTHQGTEMIEMPFEGSGFQFETRHTMDCIREGRLESEIMPLEESLCIMQTSDTIRMQIELKYPCERSGQ